MAQNQSRRAATGTGRGTYAVGDERRLRILDAAVEHFAQSGFHASSLARIAKDVGITQGGLLHHFRSKEDLLVQVLERADEQDREKFFSGEVGTAVEYCRQRLALAEYNSTRPGRTRMFNHLAAQAGDPEHPAHEYFVRRYAYVVEHSSATLRRAVDSGELKPGTDVVQVAEETTAVMDGLQIQWALDPEGFDMVARLWVYLDRLLRAVTVAGTGLPTVA